MSEDTNNGDILEYPINWLEVHRDTKLLVRKLIDKGPFKGLIAVTRGGLVPAAIVAREMGIRQVDTICASSYDHMNQGERVEFLKLPDEAMKEEGEGWLVVDDLVDSGKTAHEIRKLMPKVHIATVYGKPKGLNACDTFVREFTQDTWIHFPWDLDIKYVKPVASESD
ncbi:MAG: xanthine phosphoribosyltransferase [Alphaproteobacteria bacterium]